MYDVDGSIDELTTVYAQLRGMLVSEELAAVAVGQLAEVARDMVDSAVGAGASLMDESGRRISTATTDRIAMMADGRQYDLGQGPCISAWATASVQRVDDTASEDRWPAWCAAARALGIRAVLSAPLLFRGDAIGALKVYSTAVAAFSSDDERRLVLLSTAAATLLGMASAPDAPRRLTESLVASLADRQVVETATGVLMERHRIDRDASRDRMLEESRSSHQPLADVARAVLAGLAGTAR